MKNYYSNYLIAILLLMTTFLNAQNYSIGHKTITYNDPARTGGYGSGGGTGRQIQCEIYYPSTTTGNNTPLASGNFPIIVFGHGFFMSWDAYTNIWEHYVADGYILAFPRTEGGLSPSHLDFGKDLIIAANKLESNCNTSSDFFYNSWNGKISVMGHSMGGGDSLSTSICKQFVSIIGGGHCYFGNSNTACDLGESTSGGNISIDRLTQQDIMFDVLDPWLAFYLKNDCSQWTPFLTELSADVRLIGTNGCSYQTPIVPVIVENNNTLSITSNLNIQWFLNGQSLINEVNDTLNSLLYGNGDYSVSVTDSLGCSKFSDTLTIAGLGFKTLDLSVIKIAPNPCSDFIQIDLKVENAAIEIIDAFGRVVQTYEKSTGLLDVSNLKSGYYTLKSGNRISTKIIKL
ncbi:MAG: T9SS type A sorting domain-containing protein [Fluviicola sp.]|nr:T9SS type A sorting domain-containing protein [Fluviicola sp.]